MTGFPMLLDVSGRRAVVVGGGSVGLRRARALHAAGADVLVVAPHLHPAFDDLAGVSVRGRDFAEPDLDGAWLAFACTDDAGVNAAVAAAAEARHVFCARADDGPAGSARTPAVLRRDSMTVAVSGGDDPRRAVALRDAIAVALDTGELPARRRRAPAAGSVTLVGGGPGAGDLITVRGRDAVVSADVVVVDRLAPRALLDELPDEVEVIDCGKSAHRHNLSQQQINDVLVERARAGKRVVRLKGGDPFVFGRGGEEWLACVRAGVPVSVIPGVSSVLAAPALAGIPLTHREVSAEFSVISGHLDPGLPADGWFDWADLARRPGTLVLLMAMQRLDTTASRLIEHGRSPDTPAAVVYRASLDGQRTVCAPLRDLAAAVAEAGVGSPSVVVIGPAVAALAGPEGR